MSQVRILSSRPFSLMHAFDKRNRFYWVQMVDKSVHQAAIHATSSNVLPLSPATRDASRFEDRTQALGPHEIVPADAHEPKPEIPYGILPLSLSFQNFGIILPVLQLAVEFDDDGAVVSKPPTLEKAPEPAIASIEALLYGFRGPKPVDATKMPPIRRVENVDLQIRNFEAKFGATGDQQRLGRRFDLVGKVQPRLQRAAYSAFSSIGEAELREGEPQKLGFPAKRIRSRAQRYSWKGIQVLPCRACGYRTQSGCSLPRSRRLQAPIRALRSCSRQYPCMPQDRPALSRKNDATDNSQPKARPAKERSRRTRKAFALPGSTASQAKPREKRNRPACSWRGFARRRNAKAPRRGPARPQERLR